MSSGPTDEDLCSAKSSLQYRGRAREHARKKPVFTDPDSSELSLPGQILQVTITGREIFGVICSGSPASFKAFSLPK